jgi:hypothetical protein
VPVEKPLTCLVESSLKGVQKMLLWGWGKERRCRKRFEVYWEAFLNVSFPAFQDRMDVKVANFSILGALLYSERMGLDGYHLVVTAQKPDLSLAIHSPRGLLESKINIRWYSWCYRKSLFEVGVEFIDLFERNSHRVQNLVEELKRGLCRTGLEDTTSVASLKG